MYLIDLFYYLDTEVLIYWLLLHIIAASIYPLSGAVNFYHIYFLIHIPTFFYLDEKELSLL